jgi:hypothetical protein
MAAEDRLNVSRNPHTSVARPAIAEQSRFMSTRLSCRVGFPGPAGSLRPPTTANGMQFIVLSKTKHNHCLVSFYKVCYVRRGLRVIRLHQSHGRILMLPFWFFWLPIMTCWTDAISPSKSLACLQFLDASGNVSGTGRRRMGVGFKIGLGGTFPPQRANP